MNTLHAVSRRAVALAAVFAFGVSVPFGCSADSTPQGLDTMQPQTSSGGSSGVIIGSGGSGGAMLNTRDSGMGLAVGEHSKVCEAEGLPVKVPGCPCSPGEAERACWTGPAQDRNVGQCKDGVQKCIGTKEFAKWGPCEGEFHTCNTPGEEIHDAGEPDSGGGDPPPGCACVPGVQIACDEDCETLVICSLSGYKTCQPDGTWGPCRETFNILGAVTNLLGCRNWLHGCFIPGAEGFYTGDCAQAFTCGKAPGQL